MSAVLKADERFSLKSFVSSFLNLVNSATVCKTDFRSIFFLLLIYALIASDSKFSDTSEILSHLIEVLSFDADVVSGTP